MAEREYLIALWIRIWHWTNAVLIIVLGVTGMSLHFADPDRLLVEFSLAVRIHNVAGVILIGAYVFFVIANVVSGNWWQFVPKPPGIFKRLIAQGNWYAYGIFVGQPHPHEPSPQEHFNVLQAVTYWSVMYLLLPVISGYFPEAFRVKVIGPINFGYIFILSQFVVAIGVAGFYAHVANKDFDRLTKQLLDALNPGGVK